MGISTFTELKTSIANWIDRPDLTAVIPDFITLFETMANAELPLRTRFNTATSNLALTTSSPLVNLPTDFLEAKTFVNQTNPVEVVPYMTPAALYTAVPSPTTSGRPKGVTITGSQAEFAPNADTAYTIKLYYYQKATPLSDSNPTNWLLTNFPNLYLFGSLVAAEAYMGTDPRLKLWGDLYDNLIQKLAGSNERGQYGGSPLSVSLSGVV
jgi:hypothetical protein